MAKLYFNYAAMNAGKSTTLLQASFNYRERGMKTMLFTAAIDDRAAPGVIASRIGLEGEARSFDDGVDIHQAVAAEHQAASLACVFVDEAQFLTRAHVMQLARVVDEIGLPVLCFGLRTNFRGELFEGSKWLLALADEINELKTICDCGAKATMNLRIDSEGRAARRRRP
ncbi:MAG: thymidine kinase, partial [Amphiplicatus sp.]